MKDPRIGVFGAIALILMLLLKIATLSLMPLWTALAALVAAHAFSRFCAVLVIFTGHYVGSADRSRSAPVVERVRIGDVLIAALFGLPALALCGPRVIVAVVVALVLVGLLSRWCVRRIGGYTGDTLGATQQVAEVGCYVALLGVPQPDLIWSGFSLILLLTTNGFGSFSPARDKFPLWDSNGNSGVKPGLPPQL